MSNVTTVTEKRFGEYHEDDVSVTIRAKSGTYGGGSEVLVICSTPKPLEQSAPEITKALEANM